MSKVWIEIEGDERTRRNIGYLKEAIDTQTLEEMVLAAAEPIEGAMISGAPRHLGVLIREIYTRITERSAKDVTAAVGPGSRAFYAKFLVTGTSRMRAQDFMTPPMDEQKAEGIRRARVIFQKRIGRVIR